MNLKGIRGLTTAGIQQEVDNGGKFVQYSYCISLLVVSYRLPSAIYFVRNSDNAFYKSLPFTLVSVLFGWWGIPWGVIHTLQCLYDNLGGGKNVTNDVMRKLHQQTRGFVFEFEKADVLACQ
jgi:hypothetical protein